ncbi:hypothetical protein BMD93_24380 [Klebsiella pneumoniae]|nr:hypothetical protein BMD93_24380 [Klebsiella pneumoniae]
MTSLKTSIKTITYLSDIGCLEIQGASLIFVIFIELVCNLILYIAIALSDTLIDIIIQTLIHASILIYYQPDKC